MSIDIVQSRLDSYRCETVQEEENAVREIAQEIVLSALSRSGFFRAAAFQGGTCLRILHGLKRFSEDLDFSLVKPDKKFSVKKYIKTVIEESLLYGLEFTASGTGENAVQNETVKDDAIVNSLSFKYFRPGKDTRSIRIKVEVDTKPPAGGTTEAKFLDYPYAYEITAHDLPSLFAGKCHALLCRNYVKGRDWFDFLWYVSGGVKINYVMLASALEQYGPWKGKKVKTDKDWVIRALEDKIKSIDWNEAKNDVSRFLKGREYETLELWRKDFFLDRLKKMERVL